MIANCIPSLACSQPSLKAPTGTVFYGTVPFMIPLLIIVGLIIVFPDSVSWLPEALGL